MTVKELMENLNYYAQILGEDFTSLPIEMVGYDINGERKYNIPMCDLTFDIDRKYLTLWDR